MRIVADVIDNIFSSIRLIFLLGFGAVMLIGLFLTFGASVIAPAAVDSAVEHYGERVLEEHRAYEMGKEGWGYSRPQRGSDFDRAYSGSGSTYDSTGDEYVGGWGDGS